MKGQGENKGKMLIFQGVLGHFYIFRPASNAPTAGTDGVANRNGVIRCKTKPRLVRYLFFFIGVS